MKKKIIIIDDHVLFREGVKRILDFEETFEIVAEGNDGEEALELVQKHRPDVVLMDINMPNTNGVQATKKIANDLPEVHVIILSMHSDANCVTHALTSGAYGYFLIEID